MNGPGIQLAEGHLQKHAVEGRDQIHILQAVRQRLSDNESWDFRGHFTWPPQHCSYITPQDSFKNVDLPDVGPFWYDPLPATEHCILHRRQQEVFGGQLQHGVDPLESHLSPLQLWLHRFKILRLNSFCIPSFVFDFTTMTYYEVSDGVSFTHTCLRRHFLIFSTSSGSSLSANSTMVAIRLDWEKTPWTLCFSHRYFWTLATLFRSGCHLSCCKIKNNTWKSSCKATVLSAF